MKETDKEIIKGLKEYNLQAYKVAKELYAATKNPEIHERIIILAKAILDYKREANIATTNAWEHYRRSAWLEERCEDYKGRFEALKLEDITCALGVPVKRNIIS